MIKLNSTNILLNKINKVEKATIKIQSIFRRKIAQECVQLRKNEKRIEKERKSKEAEKKLKELVRDESGKKEGRNRSRKKSN